MVVAVAASSSSGHNIHAIVTALSLGLGLEQPITTGNAWPSSGNSRRGEALNRLTVQLAALSGLV